MNKQLGYSIASGMIFFGICTIFANNMRPWAILMSLGIFFLTFSGLGTSMSYFSLGIGTHFFLFGIFILFSKNISLQAIILYIGMFLLTAITQNLTIWKVSAMIGLGINMWTSSNPSLQVFSMLLTSILFHFLLYLQDTDT